MSMNHSNMTELCFKRFGILLLWVGITTLPFLHKPFHIDDPFVLRITENILQNPFDPFSGTFNWFGKNDPIFSATTNPPLTSYYLAPFAALFGYSEIALHASFLLFYILFAYAAYILGNRFTQHPFLTALFVMSSAAVVVSGNVMRDVPAAALATAGIAFYIYGIDRRRHLFTWTGSILCGLSILTKYSCVVTFPVLLLYPLFKRRYSDMLYSLPSAAILGLWCLHNQLVYGSIHIVYLTQEMGSDAGITWVDNAWGALVIVSSILYLFPLLLWHSLFHRHWLWIGFAVLSIILSGLLVQRYMEGIADAQFLFWTASGSLLLMYASLECIVALSRFAQKPFDPEAGDTMFLYAWFMAPLLFSILFVPFQAVRHLLLSLPPLTLLCLRIIQSPPAVGWKRSAYALFALQGVIAIGVHYADYEFADQYRKFAQSKYQQYTREETTAWFTGHWGWQYYMNRAGVAQVSMDEPLPQPGDILFQPDIVPHQQFGLRKAFVDKINFEATIPIRVMNWNGAAFYAVRTDYGAPILPYRFFQENHLDSIRVYRIKETPPAH